MEKVVQTGVLYRFIVFVSSVVTILLSKTESCFTFGSCTVLKAAIIAIMQASIKAPS